jgi:phasin family protein
MSIQNNPFAETFKMFMDGSMLNYGKSAMDGSNIAAMQRRNAEVWSNASQLATATMQALMHRQAEIFQSNASEAFQFAKDMAVSPDPEASMGKQANYAKNLLENNLANARELAEMMTKSSLELFDLLRSNLNDCCNAKQPAASAKRKVA